MSGGVDSSVAAALLKKEGCQVSGVTMKIWGGEALPKEGRRHGCYGPGEEEDIEDARKVAQTLDIDFYVFDLSQEYKAEVLDYFCHEYLSGRTPNPCLICNRKVKFDALLRKTRESGVEFDYVASGHYARVEYNKSSHRYLLKKARDLSKDQSYFIASLSQEQLGRSLFPIGDYTKEEVRKMAADFGLSVSHKPESQDFTAGGYSSLVAAAPPGPILDKQQNILGEHRGIPFYTIGQRKGLGISGKQPHYATDIDQSKNTVGQRQGLGVSAREPLYVTDIDPEKNAIIVGNKEDVYRDELIASGLNWVAIAELKRPTRVKARIRHLHQESEAVITPVSDDKVYVKFKEPQMAIAPGQAVVFYQGDIVIGAGTIERARE